MGNALIYVGIAVGVAAMAAGADCPEFPGLRADGGVPAHRALFPVRALWRAGFL